jgi:hypothetical protein
MRNRTRSIALIVMAMMLPFVLVTRHVQQDDRVSGLPSPARNGKPSFDPVSKKGKQRTTENVPVDGGKDGGREFKESAAFQSVVVTNRPLQPIGAKPRTANPSVTIPAPGIYGRVILEGILPPERPLPLDPNCATVFAERFPDRDPTTGLFLRNTTGGLADVLVMIEGVERNSNGPEISGIVIEARACVFHPYVNACQTGQELILVNADQGLHSLHMSPTNETNKPLNMVMPPAGLSVSFRLQGEEFFLRFKCDVHPWMFTYVNVLPHLYYSITDTNGTFSIPQPPPGTYRMRVQHRKLVPVYRPIDVVHHRGRWEHFTLRMEPSAPGRESANPSQR